jgi:hypothetical protein
MASSPKINYPVVQNYIVKYPYEDKETYLILAYNVDRKFQFVNLQTGQIMNLSFDTVEDAEEHLSMISTLLKKNIIDTIYVS